MGDYDFYIRSVLWLVFILGLGIWGAWEVIDYFFIDEVIKSETIITPEIEIIVNNNIVDTIYVYRQK